jgi:hypothetical protein
MVRSWFRGGVVLAVLASLLWAAPALADSGPVDLALSARPVYGKIGGVVKIKFSMYNHGPGDTQSGQVRHTYVAPPGTQLLGLSNSVSGTPYGIAPSCTWTVAKIRLSCIAVAGYWFTPPPYNQDYGIWIVFKIVGSVTGPGSASATCINKLCVDRRPGNNSVALVINTPRPKPPAVTATSTPSSAPKPTLEPAATASPTASPAAVPSIPSTFDAAPLAAAAPNPALVAAGAGAAVVLVVLGAAVGFGLQRRRRLRRVGAD